MRRERLKRAPEVQQRMDEAVEREGAIRYRERYVRRLRALKNNALLLLLAKGTPAQIEQKIEDDVTSLATAKVLLKALAVAVSVLMKRELREARKELESLHEIDDGDLYDATD